MTCKQKEKIKNKKRTKWVLFSDDFLSGLFRGRPGGESASVTCASVSESVGVCAGVSVAHTTVAGLRSISSSNFTICWMSLAFSGNTEKPDDQSDAKET